MTFPSITTGSFKLSNHIAWLHPNHLREDGASPFFPSNTQVSSMWLDQQANPQTNHLYVFLNIHLLKCANLPNLCDRKIHAIPLRGKTLTFQIPAPPICLLFIHSFNSFNYVPGTALRAEERKTRKGKSSLIYQGPISTGSGQQNLITSAAERLFNS